MGRAPYAGFPYAGPTIPNTAVPGEHLPPPIPGGTTAFRYTVQPGAAPWGFRSWGGGSRVPVWPGGGIVVIPDPERGVTEVRVWWPDAAQLQLIRITPDGVRTPVRGGYPVSATTATRHNAATNPSLETSLAGYTPSDGSPTLSTITGSVGANALRATVAGAGSCGVIVPHALTVSTKATIGVDLAFSARPTGVTITVGYNDIGGGALTASTSTLTADQINNSVGQWARQVVTATAPTAAVTVGSIKVLATGLPAGGQVDIDAVTIERGITDGSAFDGETLGGSWSGTRHLSASVLAPVLTVLDGECPLDTGVYYELYNPSLVGGRITSQWVVLDSQGSTWLTHPAQSGAPIVIDLRSSPVLEHGIEQGVFRPIGRKYAVVVSAAQRSSPSGSIAINAISYAERDTLLALFDDAAPVLVRAPSDYGYPAVGMWLSLASLTEDREGRKAWQDAFLLSAPFVQVEAPDPALVA